MSIPEIKKNQDINALHASSIEQNKTHANETNANASVVEGVIGTSLADVINAVNLREITSEAAFETSIEPQTAMKTISVAEKSLANTIVQTEKELVPESILSASTAIEKDAAETFLSRELITPVIKSTSTSVVVQLSVYPIDKMTTKKQLVTTPVLTPESNIVAEAAKTNSLSKLNFGDSYRAIREVYVGYPFRVATNLPGSLLFFYSLSTANKSLEGKLQDNPYMKNMLALGAATMVDSTFSNPMQVVLTRLQAGDPSHPDTKNVSAVIKKIFRDGNVLSTAFKGYPAVCLRNMLFFPPYFTGLEVIQNAMSQGKKDIPVAQQLVDSVVAGVISGVLASCVSYPFDIISKQQKNSQESLNFVQAATKVIESDLGWKGFYRGASYGIFIRQTVYCITTAVVLKSVQIGIESYYSKDANKKKESDSETEAFNNQLLSQGQLGYPSLLTETGMSYQEAKEAQARIADTEVKTFLYVNKKFAELKTDQKENPQPGFLDNPTLAPLLSGISAVGYFWGKFKESFQQPTTIERKPFYPSAFNQPVYSKVTKIEEIQDEKPVFSNTISSEEADERYGSFITPF